MRRAIAFVSIAAAALLAAGCAPTLNVKTDVNPNLSVSQCHTYAFAQEINHGGPQAAFGNPMNADRLRAAIEWNMGMKGIVHAAATEAADCVVGYAIGTRQVFSDYYGGWGPYGTGYGYGWGAPGWWGPPGWGGVTVEDETRISVDIFDSRSRKTIWHASVSQTTSDLTGAKAVAKINAATQAIFAKLPSLGAPVPPAAAPATAAPAAKPSAST